MGSKSKCTGKGFSHKKAQKAPKIFLCLLCLFVATVAQTPAPQSYVLRPARIFDGESAQLHDGWVVVVCRFQLAPLLLPASGAKALACAPSASIIQMPRFESSGCT